MPGSIALSFIQFVFIVCQVKGYRNILKLSCRPLFLPHIKLFQKTKKGIELVSLPHPLHDFGRKAFLLYSVNCSYIIDYLLLCREILGNMCVSTVTL